MNDETILVVDFGGQYAQLIARRVRDLNVYSEICTYKTVMETIAKKRPSGIIFTGGPNSVYESGAPMPEQELFETGVPILGICYGMQAMAYALEGRVEQSQKREFGKTETSFDTKSPLFAGLARKSVSWMSHVDYVSRLPNGFEAIAWTASTKNAAMVCEEKKLYGVQFHIEAEQTQAGQDILRHFLYDICGVKAEWTMKNFLAETISTLQSSIGNGRVLLALSGGVDSSVLAAVLSVAIGERLTCIFVDHGLMRKNESDEIEVIFKNQPMHFIRVNAQDRFLKRLQGISEPEEKRKIIGEEFIRVFEAEAAKLGTIDFLAQGTIYADVVESGIGESAVIKSHHNVGGLPEHISFKRLIEPFRTLFKDEIRCLGRKVELPDYLVDRQPFPGPGLAIRILGEITAEKLAILREADAIWREELELSEIKNELSQYFAVLMNNRSVGVMGDFRTYEYTLALRAVKSSDFMTAEWTRVPYEILDRVSNRIINEVDGINRIVYDITSKPPATIEWE